MGDPMRWLIADDNEMDLRAARGAVLRADPAASIVEVHTGARAIHELDGGHFDALLTDVRMPGGITGHDVVRVARDCGVGMIAIMTGTPGLAPLGVEVIEKGPRLIQAVMDFAPRAASVA